MTRKMTPRAYYNEHDPKAAAWIRELIKAKVITDGEVDERSIEDVLPADVRRFDRVHFFSGIGVWDYALGLAKWPEGRRVWTGSCPCQPFSAAGKGEGFDDERHLWPAWFHLIEVCRPDTIFGEQVASKDGLTWLDLVYSDLEGIDYTAAAIDFPSASVGAPHIRQRLYFVADSASDGHVAANGVRETAQPSLTTRQNGVGEFKGSGHADPLGENPVSLRRRGRRNGSAAGDERQVQAEGLSSFNELGDSSGTRLQGHKPELLQGRDRQLLTERGATNGFWSDAEWIYCRDEKYRPTKPGIFPLADGVAGRVGLLRGYGNAINAQAAKAFIESYLEIQP